MVGACLKAPGEFSADVELDVSIAQEQCLGYRC